MTLETLKGTKDSEPKEEIKREEIFSLIQRECEKFGFVPFDTPIIEYFDTLAFKYDDDAEIVQEIFKLTDRGERTLGLRYDFTTPLSRYVAMNPHLKKPFKRYQYGKVFRDGPLKKGRLREFYQFDADIVGETGQECEAELLTLFYQTYKKLNIQAIIELNNNKILQGALLQSKCDENQLSNYILSIDKLKKIGDKGVLKEIEEKQLDVSKVSQALEILSSKTIEELEKKAQNQLLKTGIEELKELISYTNIDYRLNFSLARGLDIYTGNIWEAYEKNNKIPSSLGAGGRFDNVIGEFAQSNQSVPATGISFGIAPILACLDEPMQQSTTQLLIAPLSKSVIQTAFKLANQYREKNVNTEICFEYNLKKAFKYCDTKQIEELIVLGEKDIENKTYTIKNLKTKEEKEEKWA